MVHLLGEGFPSGHETIGFAESVRTPATPTAEPEPEVFFLDRALPVGRRISLHRHRPEQCEERFSSRARVSIQIFT
jgi:hypothetical protein